MKEGELVSFGRGEEIQLERFLTEVASIRQRADEKHQKVSEEIAWREKALKEEWAKPRDERDIELIATLEGEVLKLEEIDDVIIDRVIGGLTHEAELRDRLRQAQDYSEALIEKALLDKEIAELEELIVAAKERE